LQVKRLSVKRLTSPLTFDNLGNAVKDGLYDSAMGPLDVGNRSVDGAAYVIVALATDLTLFN